MHTAEAHEFWLSDQRGWFHDEGFPYGPIHTFDALHLQGPDPRPRKVHVLVPRDYADSDRRYPVVYMNDGQTALFPGGLANKSWHVAETLGKLRERGMIEPVIIVAVHWLDRSGEYTHAPTFAGHAYGGLETYSQYLAESLKPWIDSAYRTQEQATRTAIVGSSHGGLAAFYTACVYPERFGFVGALSPSFWVGRGANGSSITLPLQESDLLEQTRGTLEIGELRPAIWIDWGLQGDGAMRGAKEMVELLIQEFGYQPGRDLWTFEDEHGGHNEDAWANRFGMVMQTFFPAK